jgi:hypothetical protein
MTSVDRRTNVTRNDTERNDSIDGLSHEMQKRIFEDQHEQRSETVGGNVEQ